MLFVSLKGSKKASIMYKSLLGLKCTVNKNRVREKLLNLSIIFEERSEVKLIWKSCWNTKWQYCRGSLNQWKQRTHRPLNFYTPNISTSFQHFYLLWVADYCMRLVKGALWLSLGGKCQLLIWEGNKLG